MADNRKYYYLKLKEGFFDSDELKVLESMPDGMIYSNILLKMYLRSLRNEGRLMFRDTIPYTPEIIATLVGHQIGTVKEAIKIFRELGLIEILDNGAIYMMDIQNFIGASSTEADRQRKYYNRMIAEKKRLRESSGENTEDEKKPIQKEQGKKALSEYSTDFEELWKAYPRKADKASAYKKYRARINDGFPHEQLLYAVSEYAAQCKRDHTEEKYIKHAKTFLGDATPFLDFVKKPEEHRTARDDENPYAEWGD